MSIYACFEVELLFSCLFCLLLVNVSKRHLCIYGSAWLDSLLLLDWFACSSIGSSVGLFVIQEARKNIRAAMKRGPASGDGVVRAATVSSELLLETLRACRSWGELFEVSGRTKRKRRRLVAVLVFGDRGRCCFR